MQSTDVGVRDDVRIAGMQRGDEETFATLFREYYDPLCRFAYRIVQSVDGAEEVVQRLFIRLWERRSALQIEPPISAYLYRATQHQALNAKREQRRRRAAPVHDAYLISAPIASAEDDDRTLARAIDRAIAQLPEQCRLVFVLNREHHMGYTEIAEVLGISHNTVKTQMARALLTLRRILAQNRR